MKITDKIELYNCDNMELMAKYPDGYFDLAIVDPPYDFGITETHYASQKKYGSKNQDSRPNSGLKIGGNYPDGLGVYPKKTYFDEIFRVSKNQIIWGGNYFTQHLFPSMGWICWYKMNGDDSYFSDFELAWTSFQKRTRIFKKTSEKIRIHPTQKPADLYKWLLDKYAKPNDKILDTHLGSMSIAIACHDYGFELVGCELDKEYYDKGIERVKNHVNQLKMF